MKISQPDVKLGRCEWVIVNPMSTKKFVDYVKRGRCTIHLGLFAKNTKSP